VPRSRVANVRSKSSPFVLLISFIQPWCDDFGWSGNRMPYSFAMSSTTLFSFVWSESMTVPAVLTSLVVPRFFARSPMGISHRFANRITVRNSASRASMVSGVDGLRRRLALGGGERDARRGERGAQPMQHRLDKIGRNWTPSSR
jgi:hypothetical protein